MHNIADTAGRDQAVREAYRVLKPGSALRIADFQHTAEYPATLQRLAPDEITERGLGTTRP